MNERLGAGTIEARLRRSLGILLIKPDAVEAGVAEELIHCAHERLKITVSDVKLMGAIIVPHFTPEQTESIYPTLDPNYLQAYKEIYSHGPLVVVFFGSKAGTDDLWFLLKKYRGKTTIGRGLEDSIRSIIPLPGYRKTYEELSDKLRNGNLTHQDYIGLSNNLAHVPENLKEFAGLFSLLDADKIDCILGQGEARRLKHKLTNLV